MLSRSRPLTLLTILGMSVLVGCQALTPATSIPVPTEELPTMTPAPDGCPGAACDPGPIDSFEVHVDDLEVRVEAGTPPVVTVILKGTLPDAGCTTIASVTQERESDTYHLTVVTETDPLARCALALTPFAHEVALDVTGLPAGTYTVVADEATATFELAESDADVFELQLQNALGTRDPAAVQALMDERFLLGYWRSEGTTIPAAEASTQIVNELLNPASAPVFEPVPTGFTFDPASMVGPEVTFERAVFSQNWAKGGLGQALLVFARRADGTLFLHSLLFARDGFAGALPEESCSAPVDLPAQNGAVSFNGVSFNLSPELALAVSVQECSRVAAAPDRYPGDAHPAYTAFIFPTQGRDNLEITPELRVYALSGDLSEFVYPLNSLADLQHVLEGRQTPIAWLDRAPLAVRQQYVDVVGGAGVRALMQYMQDFYFFSNNGLVYEYNGLTQDGRYFVRLQYAVSAPFLMEFSDRSDPRSNLNAQAIAIPDWPVDHFDAQMQIVKDYNAQALARFDTLTDSDVSPNLALLDALVQSIEIDRP